MTPNSSFIVLMLHLWNGFNPDLFKSMVTPEKVPESFNKPNVPSSSQPECLHLQTLHSETKKFFFVVFTFLSSSPRFRNSFGLYFLFHFSSEVECFSLCFPWDAASLLPEEIILYGSSICLSLPWTCELISPGGFSAWRTLTPFALRWKQIMSCTQCYCFVITTVVLFYCLYSLMEISNSLRGAVGYQVILFPGRAECSRAKEKVF